jgi:hypothetical protein
MSDDELPAGRPRDGRGRYFSTVEDAERDREAARLYRDVRNYQIVADQLGYADRGGAWRAVDRCKKAVQREGGEGVIADEAALLDELYAHAVDVLERDHVTVSQGRIMKDVDGTPLLDDGPKLAAIRELRAIRESYRKLYGIDQPSRVSVDAESLGREIGELLGALNEAGDGRDNS